MKTDQHICLKGQPLSDQNPALSGSFSLKIASSGEKDGQRQNEQATASIPLTEKNMATILSHRDHSYRQTDRNTHTHTHSLCTAKALSVQELPLLGQNKRYILSPRISGYPRVQFSSLHFPAGCLRLTGARNKTSSRNFMLTSPILTRQPKKNGKKIKIGALYPSLFPLLFNKQNNSSKEGREEEKGRL